ncbi:MAG: stage II sporulation protein R [Eubacteriales bacterium]|nr:stage II sporulation protein R [Eubacteriales bacterium]MDD3881522.1 stage II sporulation protein R [Eubacteriales bacterium]MDD4512996.1 stage II sporulation protein R [Eubacteriales bacterium]
MRHLRPVIILALLCSLMATENHSALVSDARLRASMQDEGLIRLHVIASDDSPEMQAVKLRVRDAVLNCTENGFADCVDSEQALKKAQDSILQIEAEARSEARSAGFDGTVKAEIGVFSFPDRVYGETSVPSGEYAALRITLGDGGGRNWWCVLYPSLCALGQEETAALSSGEVVFESAVWRFLYSLFAPEKLI